MEIKQVSFKKKQSNNDNNKIMIIIIIMMIALKTKRGANRRNSELMKIL